MGRVPWGESALSWCLASLLCVPEGAVTVSPALAGFQAAPLRMARAAQDPELVAAVRGDP